VRSEVGAARASTWRYRICFVIAICLLINTLKVLDLMEEKGAQADSRVELGASIWI
jgi:hypothetical protein